MAGRAAWSLRRIHQSRFFGDLPLTRLAALGTLSRNAGEGQVPSQSRLRTQRQLGDANVWAWLRGPNSHCARCRHREFFFAARPSPASPRAETRGSAPSPAVRERGAA
jgi:hypothetical protein